MIERYALLGCVPGYWLHSMDSRASSQRSARSAAADHRSHLGKFTLPEVGKIASALTAAPCSSSSWSARWLSDSEGGPVFGAPDLPRAHRSAYQARRVCARPQAMPSGRWALPLLLLAVLALSGCHAMTRQVAGSLREADLGLGIDFGRVRADSGWSTGEPGHGLHMTVLVDRAAGEYERNFDLELEGAAKILAALAGNDRLLEWDYLRLAYCIRYALDSSQAPRVMGIVEVSMRREVLLALREGNAPASEFPGYWRSWGGSKDQPDSEKLLVWKDVQDQSAD
jgi:hypothetical protein